MCRDSLFLTLFRDIRKSIWEHQSVIRTTSHRQSPIRQARTLARSLTLSLTQTSKIVGNINGQTRRLAESTTSESPQSRRRTTIYHSLHFSSSLSISLSVSLADNLTDWCCLSETPVNPRSFSSFFFHFFLSFLAHNTADSLLEQAR